MPATSKPCEILGINIETLTDFKQIEALLLNLNKLDREELDEIFENTNFEILTTKNPLFVAMAAISAGESAHHLSSQYDFWCDLVSNIQLDETNSLNYIEKAEYILRKYNIYVDISNPSLLYDFKFSHYPESIYGIDYIPEYKNTHPIAHDPTKFEYRLELNKIDDVLHVNTYTWKIRVNNQDNKKELQVFKNIQYQRNNENQYTPRIPNIFVTPGIIHTIKTMWTAAGLDIKKDAKDWLHHWTRQSISNYQFPTSPYRPDSELEALCSLLELDYKKIYSKFYTLREIGLLNTDNIVDFTNSLCTVQPSTPEEINELPYFDFN